MLIKSFLLIFLFFLKTSICTINRENRYWVYQCEINGCSQALHKCLELNCIGTKLCKACVKDVEPNCQTCVDEIYDEQNIEEINGTKYFLCDSNELLQNLGCKFYCKGNFFKYGQCVTLDKYPICECSSDMPSTTKPPNPIISGSKFTFDNYGPVSSLAILSNGDLASVSPDGGINTWNTKNGTPGTHLNSGGTALAVLSNGDIAVGSSVLGSKAGIITIWRSDYGHIKYLEDETSPILALAALKSGDLASSASKTIKIWNTIDKTVRKTLNGHRGDVITLTVLPNDDLASGSWDNTIRIWRTLDGSIIKILNSNDGSHRLAVFSNGDLASLSFFKKTIEIWDIDGEMVKKTLTGHNDFVSSLAVLPNGDLASGSFDGIVNIWNTIDGTVKKTFTGHKDVILSIVSLPNGDLASGSNDRTVKIWNYHYSAQPKHFRQL